MRIHPTAKVHPSCVLEGDIEIGEGTVIGPLCYIEGPVVIGRRNRIGPHCVIGTEAEHRERPSVGRIVIGDDNVVRELTVFQRGTGDRETGIGSRCYIMDHVHISHDTVVGDDVTIAPNVVFAGHSRILRGATIGMGAVFHQHSTIGGFAMVGMGSVVTKDVQPFCVVAGNPARFSRLNAHGLKRLGVEEGAVRVEEGRVISDHPDVRAVLEAFHAEVRRTIMPAVSP